MCSWHRTCWLPLCRVLRSLAACMQSSLKLKSPLFSISSDSSVSVGVLTCCSCTPLLVLPLQRASDLVRNKIHPTSIISGYRVCSDNSAPHYLRGTSCGSLLNDLTAELIVGVGPVACGLEHFHPGPLVGPRTWHGQLATAVNARVNSCTLSSTFVGPGVSTSALERC